MNRLPLFVLLTSILILQTLSFVYFYTHIGKYETFNTENKVINDWVFEDKAMNNTYYIAGQNNVQNFIYELITNGHHKEDASIHFTGEAINADTMTTYTYVIVDVDIDATKKRKPAFTNGAQNVYR